MITQAVGSASTIWQVVSIPPRSDMFTSIKTASGLRWSTNPTPSTPLPASPI
jgi:hypothetical protein